MSQPAKTSSRTGRKRKPLIYVVDDEALLLDLAEASLQAGNYVIKKFQDPEEALKSFLREKTKPDILISDYAMGKMNGLELIEKCKRASPELKAMLVSGTAGAEIILNAPVKVERFLGKPYQPAALLEIIQQMAAA
jgi:CheY-like chemotaxis protein